MGQVAAGRQRQAHDRVSRFQEGHHHGAVGLGAGMGLHVHEPTAEKLLGAVYGQVFGDVHELAAAVIAPSGIAFGVFVGHDAALGLHDRPGDHVFRRDQFDLVLLAVKLIVDGAGNGRVTVGQGLFEKQLKVIGTVG